MTRRAKALLGAVLVTAACETWADKGPNAIAPKTDPTPIVNADAPDAMPDQVDEGSFIQRPDGTPIPPKEEEASFIVAPRDPDRPPEHECAIERRQNEYWCASPARAAQFDDGDGKQQLGCAQFIIAVGKDRTLKGSDGFPACALGRLEPCETNARRSESRESSVCCYAISCPTH